MLAGPVADPTLGARSAHIFETLFGLRDGGRVGPGVVVEPQTRHALLEPRKIWYTIEGPRGEVRLLPPLMLLLEEERHRPVVLLHIVPSSFTVLVVVQPDDAEMCDKLLDSAPYTLWFDSAPLTHAQHLFLPSKTRKM